MHEIGNLLSREGFRTEENLDIGLVSVDLYAERDKSLWLYPYRIHCYVFSSKTGNPVTVAQVAGFHALAISYTEVFKNRRSRWFRLRVPITVSLIFSRHGFDQQAIEHVRKKQRYQMGHVNGVALVNQAANVFHATDKPGLVGMVPLAYTSRLARRIVTARSD